GTLSTPVLSCKSGYQNIYIPSEKTNDAIKVKERLWKGSGLITHSDCHYIAASILSHNCYGQRVASLIANRFPLILVDEFQDTGCFLSIALTKLIESELVRALVVGDPDQSIYEFSGANPELFKEIESIAGAKVYPLTTSQRCAKGICDVARH